MKTAQRLLRFINQTANRNLADIVFFQINNIKQMQDYNEIAAWKVIRQCGYRNSHPFTFADQYEIHIIDCYGNHVTAKKVTTGKCYQVYRNAGSSYQLMESGKASIPGIVEVENNLDSGTIDIAVFRNERMVLKQSAVCPGEIIPFAVDEEILIGRSYGIDEGDILNPVVINRALVTLSLTGIFSADIVMRGGGYGPGAHQYSFFLEHIIPV